MSQVRGRSAQGPSFQRRLVLRVRQANHPTLKQQPCTHGQVQEGLPLEESKFPFVPIPGTSPRKLSAVCGVLFVPLRAPGDIGGSSSDALLRVVKPSIHGQAGGAGPSERPDDCGAHRTGTVPSSPSPRWRATGTRYAKEITRSPPRRNNQYGVAWRWPASAASPRRNPAQSMGSVTSRSRSR